ncbi:tetratricopeptide repeat protein 28-like [Histomonas meleagridis]|uniref:tetratricopeptide repeat protein 28-like n=1 Tax=Histomonas meleagridis TaxID=135588 RepID=UPI0035593D51|nr:tetratricopeptide repeat protein 28-like [Histomonas meleagridis]KAH0806792.1 tetratricopeptide repeat protein 28-like [Histomonas meleagridis]
MKNVSPTKRNIIKIPRQTKNKTTIGCYPAPTNHVPPPEFGPNSIPPTVVRQVEAHFASRNKPKSKSKPELPPMDTKESSTDTSSVTDNFSLCIPQNPSRFSRMNVHNTNNSNYSLLNNPQRIVADGSFAVNESVKPDVISLNFDGLQPLRLSINSTKLDFKKALRDLHLLVQSSNRSGNIKGEGSAYFNIGLLYESEGHLRKANEYYLKYIQTLGAESDPIVFNRIAVNCYLLHMYDEAIEWNMRHLSFSCSMFEAIAANCNIALIYREKGEINKSVEFYQSALDITKEMIEDEDSPFYEQVKRMKNALNDQIELMENETKVKDIGFTQLSNLSFGDRLKLSDENKEQINTHEDYFDSQARISLQQGDVPTAFEALVSAGKLCCIYGEFDKAEKYYCNALDLAKQIGANDLIDYAKVAIGIVKGNNEMKKYGLFDENGTLNSSLFV